MVSWLAGAAGVTPVMLRELLISKVLTPQKWPLGVNCFENNFKNLKALLKYILHVKGSEVILDLKCTLKKK